MNDDAMAPHDAPQAESGEPPPPTPQSRRPVFLPLLALLLLTLITQLGSLPYIMGRSAQMPNATEHSLQFIIRMAVVPYFPPALAAIVHPGALAGLGAAAGGRPEG